MSPLAGETALPRRHTISLARSPSRDARAIEDQGSKPSAARWARRRASTRATEKIDAS